MPIKRVGIIGAGTSGRGIAQTIAAQVIDPQPYIDAVLVRVIR